MKNQLEAIEYQVVFDLDGDTFLNIPYKTKFTSLDAAMRVARNMKRLNPNTTPRVIEIKTVIRAFEIDEVE